MRFLAPASCYDLLVRYWKSNRKSFLRRKAKLKAFTRKPKTKLKAGQKLAPKHPGIVKKLVDRAIAGKLHSFCPEIILQTFIARCVVDVSAKIGILGNLHDFSIAFDGSNFYSGASHYGVKVLH